MIKNLIGYVKKKTDKINEEKSRSLNIIKEYLNNYVPTCQTNV